MKVSKKLIYLVLSIAIVISSIPFIGYAVTPNDFPDLPSDWSKEALIKAVNNGLLTGANGKLMPFSNLTRAQMAAIVNKAFGATRMASLVEYTDVLPSDWYFREMAIALQMGTFSGNNGQMNPNKPITREEVLTVLAKAFQLPAGNEQSIWKFRDSVDVSPWARPYVAAMIEAGYVNGSGGYLNPRNEIKRNEFAALMDNVVKHYITEPGVYTGTFNGNIIVRVPGVSFKDAVINGALVIGDGVGTGQVFFSNVDVKGATLVRGLAQMVEGEPADEGTPAGPGTPPVVVIPPGGGIPGGGTPPTTTEPTTEAPVVENEYGFRVTYKDRTYLEEKTYPVTKKFTFDVLEDIRKLVESTVIAEINDPARTAFIEDLLARVNPNTSKKYAEGIATRVLSYSSNDLVVYKKAVYVNETNGLFTQVKGLIDINQPIPVTLIREIAAELIKEDTMNLYNDLKKLYPNEKVTDHIKLFFYNGTTLVEQNDVKLVDLMDKFNGIYTNYTLESLVGKNVLMIKYDDKEIKFQVVDAEYLKNEDK
ncbi:MAG TPA: hypothetical protein DCS67_01175 [Clostridiales bacterium UBA8960]|jgi:hypothetical protein|nr:hypothetical protein [Clostridiales bacterium UBA8960]